MKVVMLNLDTWESFVYGLLLILSINKLEEFPEFIVLGNITLLQSIYERNDFRKSKSIMTWVCKKVIKRYQWREFFVASERLLTTSADTLPYLLMYLSPPHRTLDWMLGIIRISIKLVAWKLIYRYRFSGDFRIEEAKDYCHFINSNF